MVRPGRANGLWRSGGAFTPRITLQQLLDPSDRITVLVEQTVDAMGQGNIGRAIITAVAGTLKRPQLGKARLPVTKDMLGDVQFARKLAYGSKGLIALAVRFRHPLNRRWRSARA